MPVQTIKTLSALALFSSLSLATILGCVQTSNIQVAPIIETETVVAAAPTVAKQAVIAPEPPPKKAIVKEEAAQPSLQGRYDIFDRGHISEGSKYQSQYYWGSFSISTDHKLKFFIDETLIKKLQSCFSKQDARSGPFPVKGVLPPSGDLSSLYIYTPVKSGFLFSGSLTSGSGMTSLLLSPSNSQQHWANVQYIKRSE